MTKRHLFLGTILMAILLGFIWYMYLDTAENIIKTEKEQAKETLRIINVKINLLKRPLEESAMSWTLWNEFYNAIINRDISWINDNILSGAHENTTTEFFSIFDKKGNPICSTKAPLELNNKNISTYKFMKFKDKMNPYFSVIENTSTGPYVICITKIAKLGDTKFADYKGYLVYGRKISQKMIDEFKTILKVEIELKTSNNYTFSTNKADFESKSKKSVDLLTTKILSNNTLETFAAEKFLNYDSVPIASIKIKKTAFINYSIGRLMIYTIILSILILILFIFFFAILKSHNNKILLKLEKESNIELQDTLEQLKALQVQLIQSEKAATMSKITAGIVHEFNTPIASIKSNNDLLIKLLKNVDSICTKEKNTNITVQFEKVLDINNIAIERLSEVITQLKKFTHLDQSELKGVDINQEIDSCIQAVSYQLNEDIKIEKELEKIPQFLCYPLLINQMIISIIQNSIQALCEAGTIKIKTSKIDNSIRIQIMDNGKGIPAEILKNIFDVGFTSKQNRISMGLGLAIAKNIVDKHKGKIEIKSNVGQGTVVDIEIPIKDS